MPDNLNTADLHREMIRKHLRDLDLKFLTDEDGDAFFMTPCGDHDLQFSIATTPNGEVVWVEGVATEAFSGDQLSLLLLTVNTWMGQHRWPRLTVQPKSGSRYQILADGHLAIGDSLEQAEIDRFIESIVGSTMCFWEGFSLPDFDSLETEIAGFLTSAQDGEE